jgi:uncharacterized membrane protein
MRITSAIDIAAPREEIWAWIADPARYADFMSGITRWDLESERRSGLGARYRTLMRVRAAEVGGLLEVVEFQPPADLAWTSVTGIEQRGRWRLREREAGHTHVELRLSYHVAGRQPAGWLVQRIAAVTISSHLRATVQRLKRCVELEQLGRAR